MRRAFFIISFSLLNIFNQTAYAKTCCLVADYETHIPRKSPVFYKTSKNIIGRLLRYQRKNGQYASQEGKARFTDIGLNPSDWEEKPREGVIYDPKGKTLGVKPQEGYTFFVDDARGNTEILSWDLGWSLIYNLADKKWYFYEISPSSAIRINTLRIKKDSPYNPSDYKIDK